MKRLFLVVVAIALSAPALAAARDFRPGFGARVQEQGGRPVKKTPAQPPRSERTKRMEHEKGHRSRLTEQERHELHRDLDRANREIYRR